MHETGYEIASRVDPNVSNDDEECLAAAAREGFGAWRPWHGAYERAERLAKAGLLVEAGISAMPPHVVYVITEAGQKALHESVKARAND